MTSGLPTQMVWQSTLSGSEQNQDPATLVWNMLTALYYKAGRIPWQLHSVPANTCFVGVSFYKQAPTPTSPLHTSLAQVFSGHGEGLVLKGGRAFVDENKGDRKAHLTSIEFIDWVVAHEAVKVNSASFSYGVPVQPPLCSWIVAGGNARRREEEYGKKGDEECSLH